ncbi:MAG: universal stress protein [Psittacicella sp.]
MRGKSGKVLVIVSNLETDISAFKRIFHLSKRLSKDIQIKIDVLYISNLKPPVIEFITNRENNISNNDIDILNKNFDKFLKEYREESVSNIEINTIIAFSSNEEKTIFEISDSTNPDLIIKSVYSDDKKHKLTPLDWQLLKHSKVNVMLVKPKPWEPVDKVAIAIKNSENEHDKEMNHYLFSWANMMSRSIHLKENIYAISSYIVPTIASYDAIGVDMVGYNSELTKDMKDAIKTFDLENGVLEENIYIHQGSPIDIIPEISNKLELSVLVLGTSFKKRLSSIILGNTAEKIINKVDCDILILRNPK